MGSRENETRERDETLARIVAEYCDRLIAGDALEPAQVVERYPEMGSELASAMEAIGELRAAVASDRPLSMLGEYQILRELDRSAVSIAFEARHPSLDRRIALKVLTVGFSRGLDTLKRFVRDARVVSKLQHPNIVSTYELGVESEMPYAATQFVDGETLAHLLDRLRSAKGEGKASVFWGALARVVHVLRTETERATAGPEPGRDPRLPASDTSTTEAEAIHNLYCLRLAEAFVGVAEGLEYAHQHGIIHGDLRPSNLIQDTGGSLRILDLGLARLMAHRVVDLTGEVLPEIQYMSPERAKTLRIPVDHRADVYGVGITMYEMLTWRSPFQASSYDETISRIVTCDPKPPCRVNPSIPNDLGLIVLKCLEKHPGRRYQSAGALAHDLRRFVLETPAKPVSYGA